MTRAAAACVISVLLSSLPAAAQQDASERVVVTRQDLIEMTDAELPTSLIVKAVRAADAVPSLQPNDLISLRRLGVAPEVLEAVVERGSAEPRAAEPESVAPDPPEAEPLAGEPAASPGKRRMRISARLESKRGWLRNPFGSSGDEGFAVYWTVSLEGEGARISGCPREPICWCADSIGQKTCSELGDELWDDWLSCHRAVEMRPGETVEVFDFEVEGGAPEAIRVAPLAMVRARDDSMRLEAWSNEVLGPAYLAIEPKGAETFDGEWELLLTAAGSKTDLRISTTRFETPGDAGSGENPGRIRPASGSDLLPADLCKP